MNLYGLLITKEDHDLFAEWCREQLPLGRERGQGNERDHSSLMVKFLCSALERFTVGWRTTS